MEYPIQLSPRVQIPPFREKQY